MLGDAENRDVVRYRYLEGANSSVPTVEAKGPQVRERPCFLSSACEYSVLWYNYSVELLAERSSDLLDTH